MKMITKQNTRKLICISLGIGLFVSTAFGQLEPNSIANKGLLSRLLEIKYTSETYISNGMKKDNKDTALAIYNTLRWKIDAFVYTLSSEMIAMNSPRKLRQLNEWCLKEPMPLKNGTTKNEGIAVYTQMLYELNTLYEEAVLNNKGNAKTLNLTTNVFYLLKDSYTIVKGLTDMKTQKTMALIEILDHTRLLSPVELGKQLK
jgi:hypothetical protein